MVKRIAKVALVLTFVTFIASVAAAQTQTQTDCTSSPLGDSVSTNCRSTSTPTGPTAAQVEQQKEMNENASKMGSALGALMYRKRMQHAQEKSDLTAVVFCRQNPSGSWTFPGKAPTPCGTLAKNVVAYCTVNPKTAICKDVAKLGPAPVPAQAAPAAPVATVTTPARVATPQVQPQPQIQPQQAPVIAQPVQNVTVAQPQMTNVTAVPEVSVAEAARQARIAKAVREAKEKAERDNPPPPRQ